MQPNEQDWSSIPRSAKASALYHLVERLLRILETYFSGDLVIPAEWFNQRYVATLRLAGIFADEFPLVAEHLSDLAQVLPNLQEALGDFYSIDEKWDNAQPTVTALRARLSETLIETGAALDPTPPPFLKQAFRGLDRAIKEMKRLKREKDSAWLEQQKKLAAEQIGPLAATGPAVSTAEVTLSQEEEEHFRLNRFKSRIPISITGITEGHKGNVVLLGGAEVVITDVPFGIFLRLVIALYETEDGFVPLGNMKTGGGLADEGFYEPAGLEQALSRLRQPFRTALGHLKRNDFIERQRGKVRLSTGRPYVTWNLTALIEHSDPVVSRMVRRLPEAKSLASRP